MLALLAATAVAVSAACPPCDAGAYEHTAADPLCQCAWQLPYSRGATGGRLVVNGELADSDAVLAVAGLLTLRGPVVLADLEVFGGAGEFVVALDATPGTSLALDATAINEPPVLVASPSAPRRDYSTEAFVLEFDTHEPLPYSFEDLDTPLDGPVRLSLRLTNVETEPSISLVPPAVPPSVQSISISAFEIVLLGPLAAVQTAMNETRLLASGTLVNQFDVLTIDVLDELGASGTEAVGVAAVCPVGTTIFATPAYGVISDGFLDLRHENPCSFIVSGVAALQFVQLRVDCDNREDVISVWDGDTLVAEYGCYNTREQPVVILPLATGVCRIETAVAPGSIESPGFQAVIVPTPGRFSLGFVATGISGLAAVSGTEIAVPAIVVYDVPDDVDELLVTVVAEHGVVYLADPASFADVVVESPVAGALVLLAPTSPVSLLRIAKALQTVVYRSAGDFVGADTLRAATPGAQTLEVPIEVGLISLELAGPLQLAPSAYSVVALDVTVLAPLSATVELSIAADNRDGEVSIDPRASVGVESSWANSVRLSGSAAALNAEIEHLVYRITDGDDDTITITASSNGTVRELTIDVEASDQCQGERTILAGEGSFTDRTGFPTTNFNSGTTCQWTIVGASALTFTRYDVGSGNRVQVWDGVDRETLLFLGFLGSEPTGVMRSSTDVFHIEFATVNRDGSGMRAEFGRPDGDDGPPVVAVPSSPLSLVPGQSRVLDDFFIRDFDSPTTRLGLTATAGAFVVGNATLVDASLVGPLELSAEGAFAAVDLLLTTTTFVAPASLGTVMLTLGEALVQIDVIPCKGAVHLDLGDPDGRLVLEDGSGGQSYSANSDCEWALSGARAPAQLTFNYVDLESADGDCTDAVGAFDGTSADGRFLGQVCSRATLLRIGKLTSFSGAFFLAFETDGATQGDGFEVVYEAVPSGAWTPAGQPSSESRSGACLVQVGEASLMLLGGSTGFGALLDPVLFDPAGLWRPVASVNTGMVPIARSGAAASGGPGWVLLVGGVSTSGALLRDSWLGVVNVADATVAWSELDTPEDLVVQLWPSAAYVAADSASFVLSGGDLWRVSIPDGAWALDSRAPAAAVSLAASADALFVQTETSIEQRQGGSTASFDLPSDADGAAMAVAGPDLVLATGTSLSALNTTTGRWHTISSGGLLWEEQSRVSLVGVDAGFGGADAVYGFAEVLAVAVLRTVVRDAVPRVARRGGGTVLEISGERLDACQSCHLDGGEPRAVDALSTRAVRCPTGATTAPAAEPAVVIGCGSELFFGPTILLYDEPVLRIVEMGPTQIVVGVDGVDAAVLGAVSEPLCAIGDVEVVGVVDAEQATITCAIPDTVANGPADVRVALDGQILSAAAVEANVQRASGGTGTGWLLVVLVIAGVALVLVTVVAAGRLRFQKQALQRLAAEAAPWKIPFDALELEEELAEGGFGVVWRGLYRGTTVAVKVTKTSAVTLPMIEAFRDESALMATLRHPNIVLFMGACTEPPNMAIVLEFMAVGSLYDIIHDEAVVLHELKVSQCALDVVKGMAFLHAADPPIIHRDLKSPNVLVDKNWTMKVSDFGLTTTQHALRKAQVELAGGLGETDVVRGTPYWMAPELARDEEASLASDVYAFGVTLWEIVTRENPFEGQAPGVVLAMLAADPHFRPAASQVIPERFYSLITRSWHSNPARRPSFLVIQAELEHMVATTDPRGPETAIGSRSTTSGSQMDTPSGNVAILACRIPDALELWDSQPAQMRAALAEYDRVIDDVRLAYGGLMASVERESRLLLFVSVAGAVQFACDVQRRLMAVPWDPSMAQAGMVDGTEVINGLRVAMGIHFGRSGERVEERTLRTVYEGSDVHRAHEVVDATAGGQIRVTRHALATGLNDETPVVVEDEDDADTVAVYPAGLGARHQLVAASKPRVPPAWLVDWDEVVLSDGAQLGAGSFGRVHRAQWRGATVAAKILFRKSLEGRREADLLGEASICARLRHPNVCQFLGVCVGQSRIAILTEYMPRGSLHDAYIWGGEKVKRFRPKRVIAVAKDVAAGLVYLHGAGILHRDLKTQNLLVDADWRIKVTDFGLARSKAENRTMTKVGTAGCVAPEVARGERYDEAADIYSLGIVMFSVILRRDVGRAALFGGTIDVEKASAVDGRIKADPALAGYAAVMAACCRQQPGERPGAEAVVERLGGLESGEE